MAHSWDFYLKTDQDFYTEITIGTAEQGLEKKIYAEGFTLNCNDKIESGSHRTE